MTKNITVNISLNDGFDFEKISETIRKEIERVGVKVEFLTYCKVTDREPKVGDFVKFAEDNTYDDISADTYYRINGIDEDGDLEFVDEGDETIAIYGYDEFEVYELAQSNTDSLTHNGAEYKRVHRKAQPGDVVVFTENSSPYFTNGTAYGPVLNGLEIVDNQHDKLSVYNDRFNRTSDNVRVYEPLKEENSELRVGDYAKVVATGFNGYANRGDIVVITEDDKSSAPYNTDHLDGTNAGWHYKSDLVPATDTEVADAKAEHEFAKFAEGDKVRLIEGGGAHPLDGYKTSEVYEVVSNDADNGSGKRYVELSGGHIARGYAKPAQLEKVSEEELQWAEIGRKPGEFKKGDVVRIVRDNPHSSLHKKGDIGIIDDLGRESFSVTSVRAGMWGRWVENTDVALITPVEQRFDRE